MHCGNCQQSLWPESKCEKRKVGRCGLGCGQGQTTWGLECGAEGLGLCPGGTGEPLRAVSRRGRVSSGCRKTSLWPHKGRTRGTDWRPIVRAGEDEAELRLWAWG